jgi:hypothetical protein
MLQIARLEDPGLKLRKMCLEATLALTTLHKHSICHGGMSFHLKRHT